MRISITVPLFNESSSVPELVDRTLAALDALPGGPHEVVLVNDGSTDGTLDLLRAASRRDPRIVVLSLSRNFGQQAAFSAALQHATGDVVVPMDGDLQDPPEVIGQLLAVFAEGYDVVYAVRVNRKEGFVLRACYCLFYRLISWLSAVRLPLDSGDFCLLSRRVVEAINQTPERQRYLRGLRSWVGFRQIGVPIERAARHAGETKYTPRRLLKLAIDGIFSFSTVPLRVATALGALSVGISILVALYCVAAKLFWNVSPQGFTALIVSITFFSGVQMVFLGVIGEYIGRIYEETKARPQYIVAEIIGASTWIQATPSGIANSTNDTGGGALAKP